MKSLYPLLIGGHWQQSDDAMEVFAPVATLAKIHDFTLLLQKHDHPSRSHSLSFRLVRNLSATFRRIPDALRLQE